VTPSEAADAAPSPKPSPAAFRLPPAPVVATAWLLAFAWLALVDAILGPALATPRTVELFALRTIFGVSSLLALGVAFAAPTALAASLAARARLPVAVVLVAYAAAGTTLAYFVLERVLYRQADSAFDGRYAKPIFCVFLVGLGSTLFVAHMLGTFVADRRWLRLVAAVAGAGATVGNHFFYRDDYPEVHATVGTTTALLAGAALAPLVFAQLAPRARLLRGLLAAYCALALVSGVGPTPNAARKEVFRSPGSSGAWALAMTRWDVPDLPPSAAPDGSRFFRAPAASDPPVPPTRPRLASVGQPVVVFVTIDAVRADVFAELMREGRWPALAELHATSAQLTDARSPGSQTAVSLTATFAGRMFSEMKWAKHGVGNARFEYAAADPSVRFPSLLEEAGVHTTKVVGVNFLADEFGTAAGFASEKVVPEGRKHARARDVESELLARIREGGKGPLFAYAHFMEPHAPYDRGAVRSGTKQERYRSEIAAMDGTLGRLIELLDGPRYRNRAYLVVSSDHGEAFGEHGYWEHTKSLYEEMIRVPLVIRGPGIAPREIGTPVSLVDVGPTILDLFDLPTPASYVGQSLVPLLRGETLPSLERPILAEGRLRRAIVTPDAMKVTLDLRRKTVEAFDLSIDPGERDDVWDVGSDRARRAAASLEAYYEAREMREPPFARVYKP
jgi:hypothetical protein